MSTLVTDIITFLEAQIAIAVPTYSKLNYVYDPEKEDNRGASLTYGVTPGGFSQNNLNLQSYAVDQTFNITLVNKFKSTKLSSDSNLQSLIIDMQDKCHDIFKQIKQAAPGSTQIRHIYEVNLEEPEINNDNHIVSMRMSFTVKYQNSLI